MEPSKYVVISPVRNEAGFIEKTIESMVGQTIKPVEWIIVNDGSNDRTEEIARSHAREYSWLKVVNRKDRGFTQVGKGVVEAFNDGYSSIERKDWEYIAKLDCDLILQKDFFEKLFREFHGNSKLGIAGGATFVEKNKKLFEEKMPAFHPVAAARTYRRTCFEDINGLQSTLGWDTIDLLRAQMKGWQTKRYPNLQIHHLRLMSSRNGVWEGKLRTGRNFYITGYHPFFLIARSIYRLKERPYLIESLAVIIGYVRAWFKRTPLVVTLEEKEFLQKQQFRRLIHQTFKILNEASEFKVQ